MKVTHTKVAAGNIFDPTGVLVDDPAWNALHTLVNQPYVDVKDFGAVGDGVADDTGAIAVARAALATGVLYFPAGTYKTSGTLTLTSGVTIRGAGKGATAIQFSGANWWLDVPATAHADDVGLEDFSVYTSGPALGVLRCGRVAQAYDATIMRQRWVLRNLYWQGTVNPHPVGGIGLSATEYIDWTLHNVTVNNIEQPYLWDRGGNSTGIRVRAQSFKFGAKWTNHIGGCQDTWIDPEFLGPTTTGATPGTDYGYTVELDAQEITFINALYETMTGGKSQGYLHITNANGAYFKDIAGTFSNGGVGQSPPDALMVLDNGYVHPAFQSTVITIAGFPAITAGTPGAGNLGAQAEFVGCSGQLNALARALGPTKAFVFGIIDDHSYGLSMGAILFANLPATPVEGMLIPITDGSSAVFNAALAGGGGNHVQAYWNGSAWVVR